MKLFVRGLIVFILFLSSFVFLVESVFAAEGIDTETGYRFPTTCTTNGSSCENMREQDDKYNSWINARNQEVVATFEDFGIPDDALFIRNFRVKLRMKTSVNGMIWAPLFSIDYGATYFGQAYGCDECYYATTPFNSIDNYNLRWYADYRLPDFVPAEDLNSGKFRLKIMQKYANLSTTDIDTILFNIEYAVPITPTPTPTSTPTPTPVPAKTPLILIPGIGGSELETTEMKVWAENDGHGGTFNYLYPQNETVWLNESKMAEFGEDDYYDVLRMKTDGITSEANLETTGNLVSQAYQGEIDFFTLNGYTLNTDLFVFPYDWRKDISGTKDLLDQKIQQIKTQTGSQKVDIVAHSMGGLVARNYISDSTKAQNVRKLFTLGTPSLGSVDSLKAMLYGNCLTIRELKDFPICIGLNPPEVKDVVRNMISSFELAPSQAYYNFYSGEDNKHPYPYKTESGALNYSQLKNLLTSLNFNTPLFSPSEAFHTLDNSLSNTNGVDVTLIAGSGQKTLGQIVEEKRISLLGIPYVHEDMININGDGTVPLFSASLNDSDKNLSLFDRAKVFYTNQDHGSLVSSGPALNLVKNILNGENQLPDRVSDQPYHLSGIGLSVHSPVNIHVYDSMGNHTGRTANGDFEENIPGSSYDALGDAKFVWLPDNGQYDIKFESTGQGSFDFKIRKFENDINTSAALYNNIPLATTTKAEAVLDTSSTQALTLQVDQDGNGTTDKSVDPTFILNGDVSSDITPPEARIFVDQNKQDLIVSGVDENPTTVTKLDNALTKKKDDVFYVIADAAGNSLRLDVREVDKAKQDRFRIYSMQYNADIPIILDNNHLNVSYNGKKDKLNVKEQNFELKGEVKIRIQYDSKKNKSTIIVKEPKREKVREVRNGLTILELDTDKGELETSYQGGSSS